ncbi:PDDEXK family nuclease [Spelaeicoccus albus]|uniref:DUF559 domain-containing protein n=1 Tax=Spelaeicoccus albus TaxID=1280376 RepID=A0A7Z0AAG4_9MICO|nr:hypothetical protein [Spelaeicoccus albus]NYI66573.1 hypothetical protein [Spelaeicoccus albus]
MNRQPIETPIAFTVEDGRSHGLSRAMMRSSRYKKPWRGVRIKAENAEDTFVRASLAQLQRPDAVISHSTAAELLGLPVRPGGGLHLTTDTDKAPQAKTRAQLPGTIAHRSTLSADDSMTLATPVIAPSNFDGGRTGIEQLTAPATHPLPDGVRITTPLRTWVDLAAQGLPVDDLVAVGDALISLRFSFCTSAELLDAVRQLRPIRGVRHLRQAAELIRAGTDSVKETELRLAIVKAGFPEPEINVPVLDPATGGRIAQPDLQYRALRIAIEYDGDHHRVDRKQWQHDLVRNDGLIDLGWRVLLATDLTLREGKQWTRFIDRLAALVHDQQRGIR